MGLTTLVVRLPRLQRFLAYSFVIQVLLSRNRSHPPIDGAEEVCIAKCNFDTIETSRIRIELEKLTMEYTNHYSNYNKKGAWSAISLRGYRPDPSFIAKPVEMNKKWESRK